MSLKNKQVQIHRKMPALSSSLPTQDAFTQKVAPGDAAAGTRLAWGEAGTPRAPPQP